ncbi:hypothetical protein NDU88_004142 [Pleurodeles waltl]|uniref:Uncharacterized protein n=1 Tax=Pleurodeles waltl TaxID=8319 RepID=A0AAV7V0K8_PLEWA|nr:hypothetical protein NDU88_004142 [Pleurodeles waltl]
MNGTRTTGPGVMRTTGQTGLLKTGQNQQNTSRRDTKQNTTGIPTKREPIDPIPKSQAKTEAKRKAERKRPGQTQGAKEPPLAARQSTKKGNRERPISEDRNQASETSSNAIATDSAGDGPKRHAHQQNSPGHDPTTITKTKAKPGRKRPTGDIHIPRTQCRKMMPRNKLNQQRNHRNKEELTHKKHSRGRKRKDGDPRSMSAQDP